MTSSPSPAREGQRAVFHCTITLRLTHVERVTWHLNSFPLKPDSIRRIRIETEHQPNDQGQLRSTLVLEPALLLDSGTVHILTQWWIAQTTQTVPPTH